SAPSARRRRNPSSRCGCRVENDCGEQLPAGTYRLVVDGIGGAQGSYTIAPVILPPRGYERWSACPECVSSIWTSLTTDLGKTDWKHPCRIGLARAVAARGRAGQYEIETW